jgi:hypothetical protein
MRIEAVVCAVLACVLVGCGGDDGVAEFAPDQVVPSYDDEPDAAVVTTPVDVAAVPDAAAPVQAPDAAAPDLAPAPDAAVPPMPCLVALHRDADGDGFGAVAETMVSCTSRLGYIADASDCYDLNPHARPGSTATYYQEHRGDGSFDYDCDGIETPESTDLATCPVFTDEDSHCPPANVPTIQSDSAYRDRCYENQIRAKVDPLVEAGGWWQAVPACGTLGLYGFQITFTRETSYQCVAPARTGVQWQNCR